MPEQELLQATIKVADIKEREWTDKEGNKHPAWDVIDGNGAKWGLTDKSLKEFFKVGESTPIRYTKKGEYSNIKEVVGQEKKRSSQGYQRLTFEQEMALQTMSCKTGIVKSLIEAGLFKGTFGEAWALVEGRTQTRSMTEETPADPNALLKTVKGAITVQLKRLNMTPATAKDSLIALGKKKLWGNLNAIEQDGREACSLAQLKEFLAYLESESTDADVPW